MIFSKDLTDEETTFWLRMTDKIPVLALRYAFEEWNRNGEFFPRPKNILDLVEAFKLSSRNPFKRPYYEHFGRGYGESDISYLMDRYFKTRAAMGNRALTDAEVSGLLDDLDKKRGETPEWRKRA